MLPLSRSMLGSLAGLGLALLPISPGRRAPSERTPKPAVHGAIQTGLKPSSLGAAAKARLEGSYGKLPLSFEANQGQTSKHVQFLTRGPGYTLFLTGTEAVLVLSRRNSARTDQKGKLNQESLPSRPWVGTAAPKHTTDDVVRMRLVGASPAAQLLGIDKLPGKVNYFVGNDPKKWHSNIPTYAKVRYRNVYPGIDLVYYGHQGQLEYDFIVAPGGDPSVIALAFNGWTHRKSLASLGIDKAGNVIVKSGSSVLRLKRPLVYQPRSLINSAKREFSPRDSNPVDGRFVLTASNHVRFDLGPYNKSQPLVIDPALTYSTFLGGTAANSTASSHGVGAVDPSGDVFIAGLALGGGFQTTSGVFEPTPPDAGGDVFVTKINPTGSALVWSTYLGGIAGGPSICGENGPFLSLDSSGNVYMTGNTTSSTFPVTAGAFQTKLGNPQGCNAFATKLSPTGSKLVYSTYLGGTNGLDIGRGIALDSSGDAYVAGSAASTDFPTKNAIQPTYGGGSSDGFLTEVNPTGTGLVFSTFLGGTGNDNAASLALDGAGAIYVSGDTGSLDFPTKSPLQGTLKGTSNAFLTKVAPGGATLDYSTYLGGSGSDFALGLVVDSLGNAYVGGETSSKDFPTVTPLQAACPPAANDCVFASKLNAAGSALVYSTYLGGSGSEGQFGGVFAVDASGNAYLSGTTFSSDFPLHNPIQTTYGGNGDAFVTVLDPTGSALVFSTYLGGSQRDRVGNGDFGGLDSAGHIYVGGETGSTDFPVLPGTLQTSFRGGSAAFISKIDLSATATPDYLLLPAPNSISVTSTGTGKVNVNVMPVGGFNQTVNLSCTGAPAQSTCTPSPSSVTLDGAKTAAVTVSISTGTATAGLLQPPQVPPFSRTFALILPVGLVVLPLAGARRRVVAARSMLLLLALMLASLVLLPSCGGGSPPPPPPPPPSSGTPPGTYTLTVNGSSGSVSHSVPISLTVN